MAYVRLGGCLSDLLVEKSFVSLAADRIVGENKVGPNIPGKTRWVGVGSWLGWRLDAGGRSPLPFSMATGSRCG